MVQIIKPYESFFLSMIFIFSTMYGLIYFWNAGSNEVSGAEALSDNASFGGFLNVILDAVSWLSPFALVKGFLYYYLLAGQPEWYLVLDLFFLRPTGWVSALWTANYLISKIPTISPE